MAHMAGVWLDEDTACKYVGRSAWTLADWRKRGMVDWGRRHGKIVYEKTSLFSAYQATNARMRSGVTNRTKFIAGPGRGRAHVKESAEQAALFPV